MNQKNDKVNAIGCDHRSDRDTIYKALKDVTASLCTSWQRLAKARKIAVKFNAVWPPDRLPIYAGIYRELVDPKVMHGVLRLLREKTDAELYVVDTTLTGTESDVYFKPLLQELGVHFVNASKPPVQWMDIPENGLMFNRYYMPQILAEADEVVTVAKLKSHRSTGITLGMKNLFGCCPLPPEGRPRSYYHHMVRLPYCMVDFAMLLKPCLTIIEGLTAQTGQEWGGDGLLTNLLIAGDHVTATDACAARLMGNDPSGDWPDEPYRRERNYIRLAAEKGFGTIDSSKIDFDSEIRIPAGSFTSTETDSPEVVFSWRKTACEQGLYYQKHKDLFLEDYENEYIFLQRGKVVWHGLDLSNLRSRRALSGKFKDESLYLKFVDAEETEQEHFGVYQRELEAMQRMEKDNPS